MISTLIIIYLIGVAFYLALSNVVRIHHIDFYDQTSKDNLKLCKHFFFGAFIWPIHLPIMITYFICTGFIECFIQFISETISTIKIVFKKK